MKSGTLIILNGGSSAGKTTLAEAFQDVAAEPWLLIGIDAFYRSLPPKEKDHRAVDPQYYTVRTITEDGLDYFELVPGPLMDRVMSARYAAVATILEAGINVIADEVIWSREWLIDAITTLHAYKVYFVGVFVSPEEADRRHRLRGRDGAGWYRGSSRIAHRNAIYDLQIDTTSKSPRDCASEIQQMLDSDLKPAAFEQMLRSPSGS
ncbi:MAG: phosphotransferase-like protein [Candidatus Binataceae bacterium]